MKSQKVKTSPFPMSTARNPDSAQPDQYHHHTGTLTPDPLLKSGSFIDANNLPNGETPIRKRSPKPEVNGAAAAAGTSNGENPETSKRRRRSTVADTAAWLPPGWLVEDRVRNSGATAGMVDKYYIEPHTGRRFRSRKEVESYLQTGTLHKRKRGTKNSDSLEGSRGTKSKKSGTKAKASALKFDFLNVPEKITWMLTVANTSEAQESWTPFINGDERVLDSHRKEWAAAFTSLTTRDSGHTTF